MKILIVAALALVPVAASAQSYQGAVVDLQFQKYDDGAGFDVGSVEGQLDALWQPGGTFGVQLGLTLGKEVEINFAHDRSITIGIA